MTRHQAGLKALTTFWRWGAILFALLLLLTCWISGHTSEELAPSLWAAVVFFFISATVLAYQLGYHYGNREPTK